MQTAKVQRKILYFSWSQCDSLFALRMQIHMYENCVRFTVVGKHGVFTRTRVCVYMICAWDNVVQILNPLIPSRGKFAARSSIKFFGAGIRFSVSHILHIFCCCLTSELEKKENKTQVLSPSVHAKWIFTYKFNSNLSSFC